MAVDASPSGSPAPPEHLSAHGVLNVAGMRVEFNLTVPKAPVGPAAVLPVLQTLWTTIEADLVEGVERQGRRISCGPSCGACCRQLVPISRIEARHLADLVEALPEPRRSAVRERFAEALRRLEEAGLLETLRRPESLGPDDRSPLGMAYFRLGIPCPFLEQESCSIHADRPLACREYLVTSPAENCAQSDPREDIEGVSMPVRLDRESSAGSCRDDRRRRRDVGTPRPGAGVGRGPSRPILPAPRARVGHAPVSRAHRQGATEAPGGSLTSPEAA